MSRVDEARERLFVGVPVPSELLPVVERRQAEIPGVRGLRLLGPGQLHITLAFIGEVTAAVREEARAVVRAVPGDMGGDVLLGGVTYLPSPRRARVVALEVVDRDGLVNSLFEQVAGGLEERGVMRREKRPFFPHVTIARLREPITMRPMSEGSRPRFAVMSVCLYRSELRREGARYVVLERRPLAGNDMPVPGS